MEAMAGVRLSLIPFHPAATILAGITKGQWKGSIMEAMTRVRVSLPHPVPK